MSLLEQALKRPKDYEARSSRDQWAIDKRLGILDWSPSREEVNEYIARRKQEKYDAKCTYCEKIHDSRLACPEYVKSREDRVLGGVMKCCTHGNEKGKCLDMGCPHYVDCV